MEDELFSDDDRSTNHARPTSALDNVTKQNLLDIVIERTRSTNKKSLIHRLIYLGRLNPDVRNPIELGEHYENFFRSATGNFQTEPVSGLLLLYPSYFVHILEGPENVLFDVIKEGVKNGNNTILDCKVLVYVNNVPGKLFSIWAFRVLSLTAVRMDGSKMQESFENSVTDALTLIHKLANELLKLTKVQLKGALDQLTVKYTHLLIPQDLIETLLGLKELLSFSQFETKYMLPLHVTLDEELVWPVQDFPPPL